MLQQWMTHAQLLPMIQKKAAGNWVKSLFAACLYTSTAELQVSLLAESDMSYCISTRLSSLSDCSITYANCQF